MISAAAFGIIETQDMAFAVFSVSQQQLPKHLSSDEDKVYE